MVSTQEYREAVKRVGDRDVRLIALYLEERLAEAMSFKVQQSFEGQAAQWAATIEDEVVAHVVKKIAETVQAERADINQLKRETQQLMDKVTKEMQWVEEMKEKILLVLRAHNEKLGRKVQPILDQSTTS